MTPSILWLSRNIVIWVKRSSPASIRTPMSWVSCILRWFSPMCVWTRQELAWRSCVLSIWSYSWRFGLVVIPCRRGSDVQFRFLIVSLFDWGKVLPPHVWWLYVVHWYHYWLLLWRHGACEFSFAYPTNRHHIRICLSWWSECIALLGAWTYNRGENILNRSFSRRNSLILTSSSRLIKYWRLGNSLRFESHWLWFWTHEALWILRHWVFLWKKTLEIGFWPIP